MGLKKYSEEEAKKVEEAEIQAEKEKTSNAPVTSDDEVLTTIEENQKEEDALNAEPLADDEEAVKKRIEDGRKEYFVKQKKIRRTNTLVSIIVLVVLVGCFVLMLTLGRQEGLQYISYIGLGVMIAVLIVVFLMGRVQKKQMTQAANDYLELLCKSTNEFLYSGSRFENLRSSATEQLKDELFVNARFYKDIKNTRSRNTVIVNYKGKELSTAEMAGNIMIKNRLSPMFLGRFFDYDNSYDKEGCRIILQIKGGNLSRPVDDLDGIELVDNNKTYLVYTNDKNWKSVLTTKVIGKITSLKIDKTLIDVIVSIRPGKTCIGIDYSDEFMSIPVDKEFDFNSVKRSQRDLEKVLSILDEIK